MNGGAGDDTLVWNNGDGSDVMNGDAGVDRVENNLGAGDDVSTLKNENGRVRYDRTNAGPFNLSIGTAEIFELNTLGGNDTLTTAADVTLPIVADGGAATTPRRRGQRHVRRRRRQRLARAARRQADFGAAAPAPTRRVDAVDAVAADVETVDRPPVAAPAPAPAPRRRGDARQDRQGQEGRRVDEALLPGRHQPAATAPSRCSRARRSRSASSRRSSCSAARPTR